MASDPRSPPLPAFDKSALLRRHPIFRALAPAVCERLSAQAKLKDVARGATIFAKGDAGTCLFAVCSGTVQVTTASAAGKSAVFSHLREGEILGEIALLDGQPRTADAVAFTDCKLMIIERRDFIPLLRSDPEIAIKLMEVLCARLRRTSEQVEDLMFLDLGSRLVKTLLRLAQAAKPQGEVAMSQKDLSEIVGMSREMINKQLQIWVKNGWVSLERRRIIILQPDALARIVADE